MQGLFWALLLLCVYLISCFMDVWGRLPVMAQGAGYVLTVLGMGACLGFSLRHKSLSFKPPVLFASCAVFCVGALGLLAGEDGERRLILAFKPPAFFDYPVPHMEATLAPPAYSGQNSLYKVMEEGASDLNPVPEGSTLVVKVQNTAFPPTLHLEGRKIAFERLEDGSFQAETLITHAPSWAIYQGSRRLGRWPVTLLEDLPPDIKKFAVIKEEKAEGFLVLDLDLEDDYALSQVRLDIAGKEEKILPLAAIFSYRERFYVDMTASDFGGQIVSLRLTVEDEAGQTRTQTLDALIPKRSFHDSDARQIAKISAAILAGKEDRKVLARRLMALGMTERYNTSPVYYMALRSAYWRLKAAKTDGQAAQVRKMLADVALLSETGEKGHIEQNLLGGINQINLALLQGKPHDKVREMLSTLDRSFWKYNRARGASGPDAPSDMIDFRALHRLYSRLLGHVKDNQYERARAVGHYIRDSLVHHNITLLTRDGYGRFLAADKGRAIVDNLISLQRLLLESSFGAGQSIRVAVIGKGETFKRKAAVRKNAKTWVKSQLRLGNSLTEIGRSLSRVGIASKDIIDLSEAVSRDIIESLKAGEMEGAAAAQSQMLVILQNLKHLLSDELSANAVFAR